MSIDATCPAAPAAWRDPGECWCICESDRSFPELADPLAHDSTFALANGRFGCKGTRPGTPAGRMGTFIGGVLDDSRPYHQDTGDREHVFVVPVAPNLWTTRFAGVVDGHQRFARTLDLRHGVLRAQAEIDLPGGRFRITAFRLLSLAQPHLAWERLAIEPLSGTGRCDLELAYDDTVINRSGRRYFDAWQEHRRSWQDGACCWHGLTRGSRHAVAIALRCQVAGAASVTTAGMHHAVAVTGACTIDRVVALADGLSCSDPEVVCRSVCATAAAAGFDAAFTAHAAVLASFWEAADVRIDGPRLDQISTRFCIFQAGTHAPDRDDWSYGAKLLAGPHYHGVVFWDVDLFILPWLTRTFPERARRHLLFRHQGLEAARRKARAFGQAGAMYPWNAGPGGEESSLGAFGDQEIHIVGDVAWGVCDHVDWTGDQAFFRDHGAAILADCARFWAGRIAADGSIRRVIGPDEYTENVDDNAFTNAIAAFTLEQAAERCVTEGASERAAWRSAAARIRTPCTTTTGVIEQYAGYFARPRGPADRSTAMREHGGNQWLKQADVLMLPVLFPHRLPPEALSANYDFYEPRTTHHSSLSHAAHAITAARCGRLAEAQAFYRSGSGTDLRTRYAADDGGLHAAASGVLAFVMMRGFLGLEIDAAGRLRCDVCLPPDWKGISVSVAWRGQQVRLDLRDGQCGVVA